jgi:hypothetical protein
LLGIWVFLGLQMYQFCISICLHRAFSSVCVSPEPLCPNTFFLSLINMLVIGFRILCNPVWLIYIFPIRSHSQDQGFRVEISF